jgi:hypothetical protein
MSGIMMVIYTVIFVTWFVLYQVLRDRLGAMSILRATNFV